MPLSVRSGIDQGDLALSLAHITRDQFACAVLVLDSHGCVQCSPNAATLLGLSDKTLVGLPATALPTRVRDLIQQTADSGKSCCDTEFIERPDSRSHSLRLTALPLNNAEQNGLTAVLIQDLSIARRIEDDLRQLDRLASVGTLTAEMAHEIKNALVAVKTFVDLLLEKHPGSELEETVRREMKRIESIVSEVLKFSRNGTPGLQPTSVHHVLERSLRLIQPQFDGRNVTVITRFAAAPDVVQGSENHLEQAFLNLLINAAEAVNGEGTLTIETDLVTGPAKDTTQFVSQRQLRIVIRDTGAGIPNECMSRLFEPFYTTKKNGTGLGLAITRRIVHEHHGLISAESEPGKGATFFIVLPAA